MRVDRTSAAEEQALACCPNPASKHFVAGPNGVFTLKSCDTCERVIAMVRGRQAQEAAEPEPPPVRLQPGVPINQQVRRK
ncbi:MAG: hypothetical protein KGL39_31785 [Patescibacteria group bacterium]|nr:hypothetical protein [Patescibacteria group bacterium]